MNFCGKFPDKLYECEYGEFCSFAHTENEINTELIHNYVFDTDFYIFHYKTVFCPFNLTKHDKALCVYAHNLQDYRRRPDKFDYDPVACEHWKPRDFIEDYKKGCPDGKDCLKCHGWKELEYHPLVYKTQICRQPQNCGKESHCPCFHHEGERRIIDQRVTQNLMKYYPKNRIIKDTYKYNPDHRPASGSKSISHDYEYMEQHQYQNNTSRSYKGIRKDDENLHKKALRNQQMMHAKSMKMQNAKRQKHPDQSYRSESGEEKGQQYSMDVELSDGYAYETPNNGGNEDEYQRYQEDPRQGYNGYFNHQEDVNRPVRMKVKNQHFPQELYSNRSDYMYVKGSPHQVPFFGNDNRGAPQTAIRSRSAHLQEKQFGPTAGHPTYSKFKQQNLAEVDLDPDGGDFENNSYDHNYQEQYHIPPMPSSSFNPNPSKPMKPASNLTDPKSIGAMPTNNTDGKTVQVGVSRDESPTTQDKKLHDMVFKIIDD